MKILKQTLERLEIGTAQTYGGLTVFPLLTPETGRGERPYRTLDQAIADGTARVTEVSQGGSVPDLRFVNDGDRPVLLLDGEEIVGAKQNRIFNLTILAPGKAEIIIPVSCVEAGRWASVSKAFASEQHVLHYGARRKKAVQVSDAMAVGGKARSDQGVIWDDIERLSARAGVRSPTSAVRAVYQSRGRDLDAYVAAFRAVDRQVGALFALGDQVRGAEIFDWETTFAELLPKIIRSWAMDAMELNPQAHKVPAEEAAKAFVDEALAAKMKKHRAVGLGHDVRLEGRRLAGGALVHEDRVVHLCAFRLDEGESEGRDEGLSRYAERARIIRASQRGRGNSSE
jgi:hypothetical protein